MYRRMLVLLDGSELAEVVLPFAKELAARLNLEVVLLQVYGPMGRDFIPIHRAYIERSADTIKRQVKNVQNELNIQPKERKVKVRGELADGHYAEEILRFAGAWGVLLTRYSGPRRCRCCLSAPMLRTLSRTISGRQGQYWSRWTVRKWQNRRSHMPRHWPGNMLWSR
jgi:hypothetical protein